MIHMPRRSVTRFFIPMIDVLTLLFCMFLLLPVIRENESLSQESGGPLTAEEFARKIAAQERELVDLEADRVRGLALLDELAQKKRDLVRQNVLIRLLYVSPKDGTLHFFEPGNLKQPALAIQDPAAAARFIASHRKEAGERELLYIFQEPRDEQGQVAPYPTRGQEARYKEWFKDVNFDGCVKPPPGAGGK